jgi:AcrR family transcriptional regulator
MTNYHHGDLRNTLIAIATELLAEAGVHGLSLRKMAQKAGVSHNAPYMHFADKEAVLAAIAEAGFRLLAVEVQSATATAGTSTRQQLIAACTAYVKFAIDRANHIQVMFHPFDLAEYPSLLVASQTSLNLLFAIVKSGQDRGELKPGDPHSMTKAIWAMVHGVATISIANRTTNLLSEKHSISVADSGAIDDTVSIFVSFLLDGLATQQLI